MTDDRDQGSRGEIERLREVIRDMRAYRPDDIRCEGYAVAIHNDYRQGNVAMTFWLVTHENGRWLKGEGRNDAVALNQIRAAIEAAKAKP